MAYINGKKVLTVNGTIYMGENINVDASPNGVDTSTNILAKTSNQGIWVGSDTGHWYYWNGTQYADGGEYLSTGNVLSSKIPAIYNSVIDLNDLKENGSLYQFIPLNNGRVTNMPSNYNPDGRLSYLLVSYNTAGNLVTQYTQTIFDITKNCYYFRQYQTYQGTSNWTSWIKTEIERKIFSRGLATSSSFSDIDTLGSGIIAFVSASTPDGLPSGLNYGASNLLITTRVNETTLTNFDTQMIVTGESEFAYRVYYSGSWGNWAINIPQKTIEIGSGKKYTTLKEGIAAAHNEINAKVIVYPGTYDLTTEFATELANHSGSGLLIGKGMDITFMAGTYVTCLLDGSDSWAYANFEPFRISTGEDSSFTLRGLNIKCSNTRYCVHDEAVSTAIPYHHRYIECHMEYENNITPAYYVQCIGGGMGQKGYISIDGGYYKCSTDYAVTPDRYPDMTADDWQTPITYHNGNNANCDGKIFIRNVYLADKGYFRFGYYGGSTIVTPIEITNCSMNKDIWLMPETSSSSNVNFEIIKWNNEIRTP